MLADGRVLIIGGHNGRRQNMEVWASAELFSPRTRRFETAGTLATARHKHDAIRLGDGRVLVIGGADRTDRLYYATTEIYNPRTATFERGPSMGNRRYKIAGTSVLLPSGDVLVTSGGPVAELLEVGSWTFRNVSGRFPAAYRFAAAALLHGGDVLIAGGYSDDNQNASGVWRFQQPRVPPNKPMKLTAACGGRSLSARRWAARRERVAKSTMCMFNGRSMDIKTALEIRARKPSADFRCKGQIDTDAGGA